MRFFSAVLLSLLCVSLHAQEVKKRILILPFSGKVDTNKYSTAETTRMVLFHSLYSFIGLLPTVDVPEKEHLLTLSRKAESPSALADLENADLVLSGDFQYRGDVYSPIVRLTMRVWSRTNQRFIVEKDWESPTGFEFFDTVDEIIRVFVKDVLKSSLNVATLRFGDFSIGDGALEILINGRRLDVVTNDSFSTSVKVLADNDYQVTFRRLAGGGMKSAVPVTLLNRFLHPASGSVENIGYRSTGTVNLISAKNLSPLNLYSFRLNGRMVPDGAVLSNFDASGMIDYRVSEDETNVAYSTNFYLGDSGEATIEPVIPAGNIRLDRIRNRKKGSDYRCMLNGKEVPEEFVWTNRRAGITNQFALLEGETNAVYSESFVLSPGAEYVLRPSASLIDSMGLRVSFNDNSLVDLALDVFPSPDFYFSLVAGGSLLDFSKAISNNTPMGFKLSGGLEGGWNYLKLFGGFLQFGVEAGFRVSARILDPMVQEWFHALYVETGDSQYNFSYVSLLTGLWLSAEIRPFGISLIGRVGFSYDWMYSHWMSSRIAIAANEWILPAVFSLGIRF